MQCAVKIVAKNLYPDVLTSEALAFVSQLAERFEYRVETLLEARAKRQQRFDRGELPKFLPETAWIRNSDWQVAPLPYDLLDRRVEITGPVDRKMIINALNSGAQTFMADLEDSTSPTWDNLLQGQQNLIDAVLGKISYVDESKNKHYRLNEKTAVLLVRPRGWHLPEKHVVYADKPIAGALLDFGLYFFHNAKALLQKNSGPYFYLPKLQSHLEARLWHDIFLFSENYLGIANGSIKATVLIETLPAAFEMHEILYELKEYSSGLNCGRWDYIFSFIKTLRNHREFILPDRSQITMNAPCMRAYTQLVVETCHKRGVHAMGGMAAQIPIRDDESANAQALNKVRADKLREVLGGHDGTWVAHPGLVPLAHEIFNAHMPFKNQISKLKTSQVTPAKLLQVPQGTRTEQGLRQNIRVGLQYLNAWLSGQGCVPLYHLMEDAATCEISRTQIWQWLKYEASIDGKPLTHEKFIALVEEESLTLGKQADLARKIFIDLCTQKELADFLTLNAYQYID